MVTYTGDVDTESIAEALDRSSGAESKTVAKDVTMVPLWKLIATGAHLFPKWNRVKEW